jgi:hypothetical protein
VYSPKGLQYYRTATSDAMDRKAFGLIQSMRGKPDATVTIYRAMPTNMEQSAMQINPNDWVTISRDYAKLHGDSVLRGDYKIVSKEVKAKDIYTAGDSWLEWGWSPEKLDDLPPIKGMGFGASTPKTPQQAVRFETPGSPEYEAAVAKGLDMSQAGRMGRAKEMGFDTETVLYHGTAGDDFTAFADQRGKPSLPVDGVTWFSTSTSAPNYIAMSRFENAGQDNPRVIAAFGRLKNPLVVDAQGKHAVDVRGIKDAAAQGYDGVILKNVKEFGSDKLTTSIGIFDPSNIRSVNAAFDPEKSGSSTLLAAAPFAAVGGAGLTLAGEDARNQRTVGKPKTSQSARTVGKAKTN